MTIDQVVAELDDIARELFSELCEGDGQHSEALDRALIKKHLRRAALLAASIGPQEPDPICSTRGGPCVYRPAPPESNDPLTEAEAQHVAGHYPSGRFRDRVLAALKGAAPQAVEREWQRKILDECIPREVQCFVGGDGDDLAELIAKMVNALRCYAARNEQIETTE